jgi:hypothetical protein
VSSASEKVLICTDFQILDEFGFDLEIDLPERLRESGK